MQRPRGSSHRCSSFPHDQTRPARHGPGSSDTLEGALAHHLDEERGLHPEAAFAVRNRRIPGPIDDFECPAANGHVRSFTRPIVRSRRRWLIAPPTLRARTSSLDGWPLQRSRRRPLDGARRASWRRGNSIHRALHGWALRARATRCKSRRERTWAIRLRGNFSAIVSRQRRRSTTGRPEPATART